MFAFISMILCLLLLVLVKSLVSCDICNPFFMYRCSCVSFSYWIRIFLLYLISTRMIWPISVVPFLLLFYALLVDFLLYIVKLVQNLTVKDIIGNLLLWNPVCFMFNVPGFVLFAYGVTWSPLKKTFYEGGRYLCCVLYLRIFPIVIPCLQCWCLYNMLG